MTLDELITQTRQQASSLDHLELLASAACRQQELADLGDQLLDHFVQEARATGCSWSQIGTALGVSKQAVQQRHSALRSFIGKFKEGVESLGNVFGRFTSGARQAVVLAQEQARLLRHDYLGTEHLLLGVLAEGEGIGAQALAAAGITLDDARSRIEEMTGCGQTTPSGRTPFTRRAKKVLELALREALHLGVNHLGTEHILLALLREGEGVAVQVLLDAGAHPDQLRATVHALLERSEAPSGAQ
ncbi:MAG: Clp protease N-terminal domain-containing protein [Pseudonocardiaceae bacterium]